MIKIKFIGSPELLEVIKEEIDKIPDSKTNEITIVDDPSDLGFDWETVAIIFVAVRSLNATFGLWDRVKSSWSKRKKNKNVEKKDGSKLIIQNASKKSYHLSR